VLDATPRERTRDAPMQARRTAVHLQAPAQVEQDERPFAFHVLGMDARRPPQAPLGHPPQRCGTRHRSHRHDGREPWL
jgi:hypothetical protein